MKGESSRWINQEDFLSIKFAWQVGYGAFSVSESIVPRVERYIRNQAKHHQTKSFAVEYQRLMDNHNLVICKSSTL